MLEIKDLTINVLDKNILENLNLKIKEGEIHILMGPNGAGKSTICKRIMHHPSYETKSGKIIFNDIDITNKKTNEIAKLGIYYISQSPIEIEGITNAEMLRTAMQEKNIKMDIFTFNKKGKEICERLNVPKNFLHREINVGMSGGERKKNELLGMWFLNPKIVLLDEIDSGLDVDAIKIVSENLKEYHKMTNCSLIVVTHQQKLIDALNPDYVHILQDGHIIKSGNINLAKEIEKNGFIRTNNVSGSDDFE